ncbi:hypothetical protein K7432_006921 [Basidiobolus ranarum]|uniref:Uncharacterized protein n=1 Tax=Basidiobolus ranarum TaxID=34480 RepID=A0ABR2WUC0_9FUNG
MHSYIFKPILFSFKHGLSVAKESPFLSLYISHPYLHLRFHLHIFLSFTLISQFLGIFPLVCRKFVIVRSLSFLLGSLLTQLPSLLPILLTTFAVATIDDINYSDFIYKCTSFYIS